MTRLAFRLASLLLAALPIGAAFADSPTIDAVLSPTDLAIAGCAPGTRCGTLTLTPQDPGATCTPSTLPTSLQCFSDSAAVLLARGFSDAFAFACPDTDPQTPDLLPQSTSVSCNPQGETVAFTLKCHGRRAQGATIDFEVPGTCQPFARPEFDAQFSNGPPIQLSAAAGGSSTATITVSNVTATTAALTVDASGLSAPLSIGVNGSSTIAPNDSRVYTITCTPSVAGETTDQTLTFDTNDADESVLTYAVRCSAPAVPAPSFESTATGALPTIVATRPAGGSTTFDVTNRGSGTLNVSVSGANGVAAPFSIAPPSANLAAGASTTFTVSCTGTTAGSFTDAFALDANDAAKPSVAFTASCMIKAPEFDSAPPSGDQVQISAQQSAGGDATSTLMIANLASADGDLVVGASGLVPPLSVDPPGAPLAPGASRNLAIHCDTSSVTHQDQTLTLTTNDADESTATYRVLCDVDAVATPEFNSSITPPGPIAITGAQGGAASRVLTVQNVGSGTLTVAVAANPAGPQISISPNASAGSSPLGPSQTKDYTVSCNSAVAGGPFTDSFTLSSTDANEPSVTFNATCSISAVAPEYTSIPPAPGNFAIAATQGTPGVKANFDVRNDGNSTLNVTSITGAVAPIGATPASAAIAVGQKQTFAVNCDTSVVGTYARSFTVNSNDGDESAVAYSATCVVNARPPEFDSTPAAAAAPPYTTIALSAPVGSQATAPLTLRNLAPQAPSDLFVMQSGLGAPLSSNLPASLSLPANSNQTYTVTCAPTSGGTVSQTLTLRTNDADEDPVRFVVTCTGLAPEFASQPEPGSTQLLAATTGYSPSLVVRVTNSGVATLNVSASGLSAPLSVSPGLGPTPIAAGLSQDFTVTCTDTVTDTVVQTLTLAHNDVDESPATYVIRCTKFLTPQVSGAIKAYLGAKALPRATVIFRNGFE